MNHLMFWRILIKLSSDTLLLDNFFFPFKNWKIRCVFEQLKIKRLHPRMRFTLKFNILLILHSSLLTLSLFHLMILFCFCFLFCLFCFFEWFSLPYSHTQGFIKGEEPCLFCDLVGWLKKYSLHVENKSKDI